jgi:hypothetical protein
LKKHLLSTSAIIGCALAAPAMAQEWDVSFGGFMSQHVAWVDVSGNAPAPNQDGIDIHSTSEIIFTPSITLDNGLTFGVNIQLEGEQAPGTQIDESYMTISSDTMGRITIGSENSVGYTMMVSAPGVTSMAINSPSVSTFIPFSTAYPGAFRQAGLSAFTEVGGNNDVQRISYVTPSFNGFTLGVSYAPTGAINVANSINVNRNLVLSDVYDVAANYSQTFGTTSVTVAARYGTGSAPAAFVGSDPETWGVGAQVGFSDFTVGASWAENDNGVAGGAGDSEGWAFGVTYDAPGPWAFEAQTYQGKVDVGATKADYQAYRIGASRDLGPGVDWDIYAIQLDSDNGLAGAARLTANGTLIGTGINLSF